MFKLFLFLLALVSTVRAEPKFIPLNKLSPLVISTITNVENGANVYLASKDDDKYLKNIFLKSGDNTYTLDQLNDFDDNSTPKSIQASGDLTISTTNDYDTTTRLTGFIYVTTKVQALDPNFLVYVIKTSNSISVSGTKATAVILNTKLNSETADADEPFKTSYVTEITQSPSTNINFQWGLPSDDWQDGTNNTFFQNPIQYANFDTTFFNHIEPLQIGLDLWYFTVTGTVKMRIENKYVSNHDYTTTAVSTTGLILGNNVYQEHVVNFQRDDTLSGTSGLITTAFVQTSDLTTFMQYNSNSIKTEYNHEIAIGNLDFTRQQPMKLTISSTSLLPGTFYCQYFTMTGGLLPTTTPQTTTLGSSTTSGLTSTVPSSTTTVATTTKGYPVILRLECILALLILFSYFELGAMQ
ncbi:hypothetical protein GCK72_016345 [Caenorhabditis remanei]|uniref:CUB-like domain-containing protein n=1 Tax=Caenorhabditis remanei TaxID=31234 RepID=A0A6A5GWJ7_CAERE|nr:hypothetical protein GCK72_016345 [Caenorhabditis remanei]KAF1759878.1 hypothetical protein GCK72_016345 [Caenorhabditis remanei]